MNPYLAGIMLGVTLFVSYLVLGSGLGASAGLARIAACIEGCVAPLHTQASEYFGAWGKNPLSYYLVFMFAGTAIGGLISAVAGGRAGVVLEKGKRFSAWKRAALALTGGAIVGFASRLGQGCTSGQALSGGALLLTGSLVFMMCIFAGGYAFAYIVRRQWHD
ncbi:MAG TPA: YeeE/YedE thiosulfate transporter family protein [bacterium]|nr:YeeE/YedE thiosulfate transporter family protein [bacterium]